MSLVEPIRIGVLMDYVPAEDEGFHEGYEAYPDLFDPFRMVADDPAPRASSIARWSSSSGCATACRAAASTTS
jgi:hypothetical protein